MWWWLGGGMWTAVCVASLGFRDAHQRLLTYRPPRAAPGDVPPGPHACAYLRGGARRSAQTALTALYLAGLVTVTGNRIVRVDAAGAGDRGRLPADPVEAAALALCRPGRGERGTRTEERVGRSRAVRRLGASLGEEGLLPHPGLTSRLEGWRAAALMTGLSAFLLGMIAIGALGGPHGVGAAWTAALSPALGLLSLVPPARVPATPREPTEAGRRLTEALPAGTSDTDRVLYQVAALGTGSSAVPRDLRRALWRPAPSDHRPDDPPGLGGAGL
ncbi:TIGR04222 domain-containing membrane protein [Streptomyces sp. NPDC093071]|uniref:TIGR04222 domain-containing membrane protein n=1 Tax=Streptomyces sp. NPDC093071 TaxID=3366022 RepID=UPI00380646E0